MHVDYLILGQGLAGTLLSRELLSRGHSVYVTGRELRQSAGMHSSAVIQPLAGRKLHLRPQIEAEQSCARSVYQDFEAILQTDLLHEQSLLRFYTDAAEQELYEQALRNGTPFLNGTDSTDAEAASVFESPIFGMAKIAPVYRIDASLLLESWQNYLKERGVFSEANTADKLQINAGKPVVMEGLTADKLVYCEGSSGRANLLFPDTIMNRNRGEYLELHIPGLNERYLYQGALRLVPKGNHLWWCGSNYTWEYADMQPDAGWRQAALQSLQHWLKIPFTLIGHNVAERPTTAGQRPLLLQHEVYRHCYFFNGLGTRGYSAGPLLARQMADMLTQLPNP
ncbi:FAD-dependent oxidoreductase [Rurimicrobium arvi]|uniref:FAD-dependent oxidoreductase n=1 Tax=Rurimicrobium arvi TaxID=2049916 RepID=A0ABP8MLM9_9BACT